MTITATFHDWRLARMRGGGMLLTGTDQNGRTRNVPGIRTVEHTAGRLLATSAEAEITLKV